MTLKTEILEIIAEYPTSTEKAAQAVYRAPKPVVMYAIEVAIEHLKGKQRAAMRRSLTKIIEPEFEKGERRWLVFTPQAQRRFLENAQTLFDTWMINGTTYLGDATKEDLQAVIRSIEASEAGQQRRVRLYRAIEEPLKPGGRVREYWKPAVIRKMIRAIDEAESHAGV